MSVYLDARRRVHGTVIAVSASRTEPPSRNLAGVILDQVATWIASAARQSNTGTPVLDADADERRHTPARIVARSSPSWWIAHSLIPVAFSFNWCMARPEV